MPIVMVAIDDVSVGVVNNVAVGVSHWFVGFAHTGKTATAQHGRRAK
jgi:hypothetical protein